MVVERWFRARAALRPALVPLVCLGLLFVAACGSTAGPTCGTGTGAGICTRVLFLGNSYTSVNDLPSTFAMLARSGGRPVAVAMVADGGETLADHASSSASLGRIEAGGWNYVVLQEQSETPASSAGRDQMYPAARTLASAVESAGATPIFFMTWAHSDGLASLGLPTYEGMQQQIDAGYLDIARQLGVPVAPVGFTWYIVRHDHPDIGLWADDGSHPSVAGTYLAACVFYASIFRQSPEGLAFHDGVPDAQAAALQTEAGKQVLELKEQWGLR